jgi:DNA-binding transcriptional ArsR family regulator
MAVQLNPFEVLADPTRREILEALRSGERAVNDIVAALTIHQSGVSRHLRILNESGFVNVRAAGPQRFYSLRAEPFQELDGWLGRYRALWEARLDRLAAALARKQQARAAEHKALKHAAKAPEKKR